MVSHPFDFEIQTDLYSTSELTDIFSEQRRFNRWLEIEAALAQTQARLGIIPADAAHEISSRAHLDEIDHDLLREEYTRSRNSLIPLIKTLRRACGSVHGEFVHFGATTQDILDTSQVMELRDVFRILYRELRELETTLIGITREHLSTPMIGRTHGQHALPITFGLKTASWLGELRRHIERIKNMYPRIMTGQLSGAVGTMAALGPQGSEVSRQTLAELGLMSHPIGWHTSRDNIAEASSLMAMIASTSERIAGEIFALAKSEVGELQEPPPPGESSSTMPHKRNPVLCQRISVMARHVRALNATVVDSMVQEHERDTRALWSEWLAIPQISVYTGTALHYINQVMAGLEIDTDRMAVNLELHSEMVMTEWLQFRLAESMGKTRAQAKVRSLLVKGAATGSSLKQCLLDDEETAELLNDEDLDRLGQPETYTGLSEEMVTLQLQEIEQMRQQDQMEL